MLPELKNLKDVKTNTENIQVTEYINQYARKILINSLYGALGTPYFRFYDIRNAEAVTLTGQLIIKWGERAISRKLDSVLGTDGHDYGIYGDTDSTYIDIDDIVTKKIEKLFPDITFEEKIDKIDKFCDNVIQPVINKAYEELKEYTNSYMHCIFMDREVIASSGFWTAKKKYAVVMWDSEGDRFYDKSGKMTYDIKIKGLETKRSSTPLYSQKVLNKSIEKILFEDEKSLQEYVKTVKKDYCNQELESIAQISSVNNFDKYIDEASWTPLKGAGINHKAACAYNKLASKVKGLELIKPGNKLYMVRLQMPNPIGEVFGWPSGTKIPKEFGLDIRSMLDEHTMIDKGFLSPLELMCKGVGWEYEKKESLTNLLGI